LLHPDAMDILQKLTLTNPNAEIPGQIIDEIKLKKEAMIPLKTNKIGVKQYPIAFVIKNTENNLVIREL
jgi:hypothetical protein